jgi:ATP-dependent HslUV protease subunit HslV
MRLTRITGETTLSSIHATTILAVKRDNVVALAGDGQMTMGDIVLKHTARKIRRLYHDKVISGFAGAVADALQLFDKFESELERNNGNLRKSAVDLAKEWRTDRFLRRLEATLLVADQQTILVITGEGEVIEPDGDTIAIGSGGAYAQAAATALLAHTTMSAPDIARTAMEIAADLCIYTNRQIMVETMGDQT